MEPIPDPKNPDLVIQPTAAPTRKMQGVGVAAVLAPLAVGLVSTAFPDLSISCAGELGSFLTTTALALAATAGTFLTGYIRKERA